VLKLIKKTIENIMYKAVSSENNQSASKLHFKIIDAKLMNVNVNIIECKCNCHCNSIHNDWMLLMTYEVNSLKEQSHLMQFSWGLKWHELIINK